MSLIKNAPVIRNPWTDSDYMDELLEEIRAASPQPIESLTVDVEAKVVRLVSDNPWTAQEFNRFNKRHWPVDVSVEQ